VDTVRRPSWSKLVCAQRAFHSTLTRDRAFRVLRRQIPYNELFLCKHVLRLNRGMCDARAKGRFILAKIPIAKYPRTLQEAWDVQPLKGKGMERLLNLTSAEQTCPPQGRDG